MLLLRSAASTAVVVLGRTCSAIANPRQATATWVGGNGGFWSNPLSWSPQGVPGASGCSTSVLVDGDTLTVSHAFVDISPCIQDLTVNDLDTVTILPGALLYVSGSTLTVDGRIKLASDGTPARLMANTSGTLTLAGGGDIVGSDSDGNVFQGGGAHLTIPQYFWIHGAMQFGANGVWIENHGLIEADKPHGIQMDLANGFGNTNQGTIGATGSGILDLQYCSLDNTGGTLQAVLGGSLLLRQCTVHGGTIHADPGGSSLVADVDNATVDNLTIEGPFAVQSGTTLYVGGTLTVPGAIVLGSTGPNTDFFPNTGAPVTLTGGGTITGTDSLANRIVGQDTLIVANDFKILGAMRIGANQLKIENAGKIVAALPSGIYFDPPNAPGNTNTGELGALDSGLLTISSCYLDNTGGTIFGVGATALISHSTIHGGDVSSDGLLPGGSGDVVIDSATLDSVKLNGKCDVGPGTQLYLTGSPTIQGTINLNSNGNPTDLFINQTAPLTLAGDGQIIGHGSMANRLWAQQECVVTVAPGMRIMGSMTIGNHSLRLHNQGHILADEAPGILMNLSGGPGSSNSGTLDTLGAGATLVISGSEIDNTGGEIDSSLGGETILDGTATHGGDIWQTDPTATVVSTNSTTLDGVTIHGQVVVDQGFTSTMLTGSLAFDTGSLLLNSSGVVTDLYVNQQAPLTISGNGEIVGTNTQANRFWGPGGSAKIIIGQGVTLRGATQLGATQLMVENNGTIAADASAGMTIEATHVPNGFLNHGTVHLSGGNIGVGTTGFVNDGLVTTDPGWSFYKNGDYVQVASPPNPPVASITTVNGDLTASNSVQIQGGLLQGTGTIQSTVVMSGSGSIDFGLAGGTMTITGDLQMTQPTVSTFDEMLGSGPGQFGKVQVNGAATVAGSLAVARFGGFAPTPDQVFEILHCNGRRTGTFSNVNSCDTIEVTYGDHSVSVRFLALFSSGPDFNHDGHVNGADLGFLLGHWGPCSGPCCDGDINGDGIVNGADLALVLGNWG